jgi:O-antigen ligase
MSRCSSVSSKSTGAVYGRVRDLGPVALPLVLIGGVAFDNGGYDATTWGWSTLLPLIVVGALLVVGRASRPGRLGITFLGALAGFGVWTWLSAAWSDDLSQSVLDGERLLLYVAAVAAFLALGRRDVPRFLVGALAAVTIVCGWALYLRAFGGRGSYDVASVSPDATKRLAAPIGYSNGLGVLAAIGVLIPVGLAVRLRRALAAAPAPICLATLYFTYSRGAWLALGAGALAALTLARPRLPRRLPVALAAIVVVVAVVLALIHAGGPGAIYREFSGSGPTVGANKDRRLFSLSGSSRAQYWDVAWREYEANPLLGSGAGSFQRHWLRLRPAALPVRDAHSLYLETLAEVGPVGLLLLAAALAVPVLAGIRARSDPLAAPAFGGYVAYLVHAAQDWDWELPAVTLAGLACAVTLLRLADREPRRRVGRRARGIAVALAALLAAAAATALAGNAALAGANSAIDADEPATATRDAHLAQRLVPWSPDPWRLRGEALLAQGEVDRARRSFRHALRKDAADWEAWADLALVTSGSARRSAVAHARRLNPLEPELERGTPIGG